MENLTKQNFWDKMYDTYPAEMRVFDNWIAEYAQRVDWDVLFWTYGREQGSGKINQYHDIPIAMQFGIFLQFIYENDNQLGETRFVNDIKETIDEYVAEKHNEVKNYTSHEVEMLLVDANTDMMTATLTGESFDIGKWIKEHAL